MAKGWWVNLILLGILASAGGGLWWLESRESARLEAEKAAQALSPMTADQVREIRYRTLDKVEVTLTREGEQWRITAPKPLAADPGAVTRLLSVLAEGYQRKVGETPKDLLPFGLADPVARLTVLDGQGGSVTLLAGTTPPAGQGRYLRLGETGPVVLTEGAKVASLIMEFKEFRHKGTLPPGFDRDAIARVTLERSGETLALQRPPAQPWTLTAPLADQADSDRVGGWLNLLTMAQGSDFKPLPPRLPDWTLTLATAEGAPQVIRLWRGEKEVLAQRPGEEDAVTLADYLAEDLDKPVTELIFLRPWPVDKGLAKITVTRGDRSVSAEKKEGQWPQGSWNAVEEALVREAWRGRLPKGSGTPLFILTAEGEGTTRIYPFWKELDTFHVGLADRPVDLLLTALQTKNLEESLGSLFGDPKPTPPSEGKP